MTDLSTPSLSQHSQIPKSRPVLKWILAVLAALLVLAVVIVGWSIYRMNFVPADLDLSTRRSSAQGLYSISYSPQSGPIVVNQIHSWVLHVESPDGRPVEDAQILVDGDMPQHGHGLPTRPQVTRSLGNGNYLVEGVKFHMPGWWVMDFEVTAGGKTDKVRFNLMLK